MREERPRPRSAPVLSDNGPTSSSGDAAARGAVPESALRPRPPALEGPPLEAPDAPLEELARRQIALLGEDPDREGLRRTPARVARALRFLTSGYREDVQQILRSAIFDEQYDEMVIVKDVDFYSLCEHHLLPFYGKAHVAYIPNGKIVGLSKIPRIVNAFARRLQVQERMTQQIARSIQEAVRPLGVAVVLEGFHFCLAMRGVEKQNAFATTSAMLGVFRHDRGTRAEFMNLIGRRP
jgi:GTP cyclohydrolase I